MTPYTIEVPDEVLDDLQDRLARVRFPDQLKGAGWDYGTELSYMEELVEYWRTGFDWRLNETALNRWENYTATVNGLKIHFIHQRSPNPNALPLLMQHGWPTTPFEFTRVLGPLSNPEDCGDALSDAFHVVCPSIPGYGFSDAPRVPGFDVEQVAKTNIDLMNMLGYARFGVQGGDWGAPIAAWMAALAPMQVVGVHLNMVLARPPKERMQLTKDEEARLADAKRWMREQAAYQQLQATKPQTLGYALSDSPVGLAAWLVEKFRSWSDCNGDVESRFTKDQMLSNIMMYWVRNNITSSMRLYYESNRSRHFGPPDRYVEAPTACAVFPKELSRLPRCWAEQHFNITQWTEMPRGGHFAAAEEPELLVDDIRKHFRGLR